MHVLLFSLVLPLVLPFRCREVVNCDMKRGIDEIGDKTRINYEVIDLVDSDDGHITDTAIYSPGTASKVANGYKSALKGNKIYLMVPYPEKDLAKQLGAKFDGEQKLWYVPVDTHSNTVSILSVYNRHWGIYLNSVAALDSERLTKLGAILDPTGKWYIEANSSLNNFIDWLDHSDVASVPVTPSYSDKQSISDNLIAKLSIFRYSYLLTYSPTHSLTHSLSWNVNGIGDIYGESRRNKMCDIVVKQDADIIFLQEVVAPIYEALLNILTRYNYRPLNNIATVSCVYFTAAFIKNKGNDFNISVLESIRIPFPSSEMGRDYCTNKIRIERNQRCHDLTVINTHLESLKEYSEVRKAQLKQSLGKIDVVNGTGILLGDLNIRENEMKEVRSTKKFNDVWEDHCKDLAEKNTWFGQGEVTGFKARYDRILYIDNAASLRYSQFKLIGKETYIFADEPPINGGAPQATTVRYLFTIIYYNLSLMYLFTR